MSHPGCARGCAHRCDVHSASAGLRGRKHWIRLHIDRTREREADRLRVTTYLARYGKFPFDERMMDIIRDPAVTGERLREAVSSLAFIDDRVRFGITVWTDSATPPKTERENPAIAKFSNPTAAEAILAAMKRDLAAFDAGKEDPERRDFLRRETGGGVRRRLGGARGQADRGRPDYGGCRVREKTAALPFLGAAHRLGDDRGARRGLWRGH